MESVSPPLSLPDLPEEVLSVGEATARLFQSHGEDVWRFLKYLGVREQELPDACQEVFLVVHRKLPEFRAESSARTWLYGICLRVAKGWRRGRQLVPLGEDNRQVAANQEQELQRRDTNDVLCWALDQISESQREVFVLHEIEELPMAEVAARVDCGLFTAYSRLRLARGGLKRALTQRGVTR